MSATVREKVKGSGRWYVIVIHNGHRKSAVATDKRQADLTAREINKRILEGTFQLNNDDFAKTFSTYGEIYIANATIKPSTLADYKSMLKKHINPVFGSKTVDKINRLDIKNFLRQKLKAGLSISTVDHFRACISNVLDLALDADEIDQNPATRLGRITTRDQMAHKSDVVPIFLTRELLTKLLATFLEHKPEHYPLALMLARTGMRIGEAIALKWDDIDFDKAMITVKRAKSRTIIDTPKSGKSRNIDMSNQLSVVLKKRYSEAKSEWVFPGIKSETIDATAWRRRTFDKILELAGLQKMRVHDLRHTYASLMLAQGQPLIYVQRQLGHHSIQITADIYSHLIPTTDRKAVNALDD
ncbi:MAG: site-specific integrase [Deltaproteobacteria bacterium]|nr:site-specific integrase [Deltaproteobacteria bacterium]